MATAEQFRSAARQLDGQVESVGRMGRAIERLRQDSGVAGSGRTASVINDALFVNAGTLTLLIPAIEAAAEACRRRARVCDGYDEEVSAWQQRHRAWRNWTPPENAGPDGWLLRPQEPTYPEPPAPWVTAAGTYAVIW